ncbi:MAG: RbsD/FucU domain-containing protein [Verrucomicrobiota bacterium]
MNHPSLCKLWAAAVLLASILTTTPAQAQWRDEVKRSVALFGHRNWIVIVDSAYPAQTSPGIQTIVVKGNHTTLPEIVTFVLDILDASKHVRPIIYTDAELPFVSEKFASGITDYRRELAAVLGKRSAQALPHEQIIQKLDEAGKTFKVLIIKTPLALPYTSVFLQLDCGYWSAEAEETLRETINSSPKSMSK